MYVCMYVCMYACRYVGYVSMYIWYVCMYVCMYVLYVCMYVCTAVCIYVSVCVCMDVCKYDLLHNCLDLLLYLWYLCMTVCQCCDQCWRVHFAHILKPLCDAYPIDLSPSQPDSEQVWQGATPCKSSMPWRHSSQVLCVTTPGPSSLHHAKQVQSGQHVAKREDWSRRLSQRS